MTMFTIVGTALMIASGLLIVALLIIGFIAIFFEKADPKAPVPKIQRRPMLRNTPPKR